MEAPPPPGHAAARDDRRDRGDRPGAGERVVLVRLSHLGDVVHALPVHHALRRALPAARLAWAVQPEFAGLLAFVPGLDVVVPFDRRAGPAAWPRLRRRLRALDPTWAVDAQGNWKSALAARLTGARRRSGLARADWREPSAARLVPDRPTDPAPGPHAVDRMLHLARHVAPGAWGEEPTTAHDLHSGEALRRAGAFDLGLPRPGDPTPGDPDLAAVSARADATRAAVTAALGGGAGAPVVLALGRPGDLRSWPAEHAADLTRRLAAVDRRVLVLSGPAEEAVGAALAADLGDLPGVTHLVGQRGLVELAAGLETAADLGARYVGADSGPLHLAWAVGLPVVCLAGPQDPARTGPWPPPGPGSPHRVVTAPGPLACRPCRSRRCANAEGPVCLTGLPASEVLAALA